MFMGLSFVVGVIDIMSKSFVLWKLKKNCKKKHKKKLKDKQILPFVVFECFSECVCEWMYVLGAKA